MNIGKIPPDQMRLGAIGIEFICVFGMFLVAGILLDRWLHTVVLFTLLGTFGGFGAALYHMVRRGKAWMRSHPLPPRRGLDDNSHKNAG